MTETATPIYARHRLAWLDQLAYALFRATGRNQLMQCIWLYDRDVNLDALALTYERLAALAFNRLIEPSPLPWGRPRWVKPAGQAAPIQSSEDVLPRSQLLHWANDHARATVDPVTGPAWRVAIQRFDDGCSAVSLVGSHLVVDGMGAVRAIAAAANGLEVPNGYRTQGTRNWLTGCLSDMWQILADTPRILAAFVCIAQASWHRRPPHTPSKAALAPASDDDQKTLVALPAVAMKIDAKAWDACAVQIGGRPNALLFGFVATLAARLGRCRSSDGAVSLLVPIDRRRGLNDERALAIEFHTMTVTPAGLTGNLKPLRAPLRALLQRARAKQANALSCVLPAISWMPRAAATRFVNRMFTYADALPVSCSDLGVLPDGFACIDGAPCARVLTRAVDQNVTRRDLERSRGHLVVVASRYGNSVSVCVEACQLEPAPTTREELRMVCTRIAAEFGLDAAIEA